MRSSVEQNPRTKRYRRLPLDFFFRSQLSKMLRLATRPDVKVAAGFPVKVSSVEASRGVTMTRIKRRTLTDAAAFASISFPNFATVRSFVSGQAIQHADGELWAALRWSKVGKLL